MIIEEINFQCNNFLFLTMNHFLQFKIAQDLLLSETRIYSKLIILVALKQHSAIEPRYHFLNRSCKKKAPFHVFLNQFASTVGFNFMLDVF